MRLEACLPFGTLLQGDLSAEVTRVVYDSRQAGPGTVFVAIPGFKVDGHDFVADAVSRGCTAVVLERPVPVPPNVAVLQVASARRALSQVAAAIYEHPSRSLRVIGVTGTNGKTTTTHLIRSILTKAGYKVGLIGTVQNFIGDEELPSGLTTPQASDVHELMRRMVEAGCSHLVMEVSSEGLDMNRVADVEYDIAVYTNLTQDHLNYHGTLENYREAKLTLFRMLSQPGVVKPGKAAVLNMDDPSASYFREASQGSLIFTYGLDPQADVNARDLDISSAGSSFLLKTPKGHPPLKLQLAGKFNVYNAMAAATVGLAEGIDLATVVAALEGATGVAGRMEAVSCGQSYGVFVDYAHSPDGLENVLRTAQGFARGRVISVFGCGGDRDRTKRPQMGRVSAELADYTIITSDNPRTEEPGQIVRDIEAGVLEGLKPGGFYEIVIDRTQAIARAVEIAEPHDVIIIAGKGHETYQIFRDKTIHFDDREVVRSIITARMAARREGA